jgi:tetratricopeptide (TPR) repeat protein
LFIRSFFRRAVVCAAFLSAVIPSVALAVQETGPSKKARDAGDQYLRALQAAAMAFVARDYPKALEKLDIADQIHADIPDTWSMRGLIYVQQHDYAKAEEAFAKEIRVNPGDFWGPYNLAELLLVEKKYADAAESFQRLMIYKGHEELVQYKVVLCKSLAGKPAEARPVLDAMKFPCDAPGYYFAHAAWAFASKDAKEGNSWWLEGVKVFGEEKCASFYDALALSGWVPARAADGSIPTPSRLLQSTGTEGGLLR